jgi:hypothetical protein
LSEKIVRTLHSAPTIFFDNVSMGTAHKNLLVDHVFDVEQEELLQFLLPFVGIAIVVYWRAHLLHVAMKMKKCPLVLIHLN